MEEIAARNSISTNDKRHKPRKVRLSKKADGGAEFAAEITPRLSRASAGERLCKIIFALQNFAWMNFAWFTQNS
ncbi:MAG: hypothetical protein LBK41_04740, partial [Clostridiales bacterium]|nr:hypothetical protein [Clostridiales bacterium]